MKSSNAIQASHSSQKKTNPEKHDHLPVYNSGFKSNIQDKHSNIPGKINNQEMVADLVYLRVKADEDRPE